MTVSIGFQKTAPAKIETVIAVIYQNNFLTASAGKIDQKCSGLLRHYLKNQKAFTGKAGQTLMFAAPEDSGYTRVILVGLGDPEKLDLPICEETGGKLYLALKASGACKVLFFIEDNKKQKKIGVSSVATHLAMGVKLGSYSFDKYKSKKADKDKISKFEALEFVMDAASAAKKQYAVFAYQATGVFLARDLVNDPPNTLYPESFAKIIKDELKPLGVEIEIFDEKKMEKLGFHAHLAVGMGSARKPRVVVMRWKGTGKTVKGKKKNAPLAFVGKGVTFDTGGMNLKPTGGMEEMKLDMGGAATVVGLMKTLALRKAKVDAVGIVGLAENMPSHDAYRPSDIIQSLSGKTIEVMNTDAEGRLVLADCISYVQRTDKPRLVIDLATLTGAMMVALGHEYCGTFVNDDEMWSQMKAASAESGEKLWRMPLDKSYAKEMESSIADIKTLGNGRYGGACTAAGFLEYFIEDDRPWAHMDIAGTAWIKSDRPTAPKPATGFGVRVLDRFIANSYEG